MTEPSAIDELFPGLVTLLEERANPSSWQDRSSRLFNIHTHAYLYPSSNVSDSEHENRAIHAWLKNIECHQWADISTIQAAISQSADKFMHSSFSKLDDIDLHNIHDTAEDIQVSWSCMHLKEFIASQCISLGARVNRYSQGLLIIYGIGQLQLIAGIASRLKPRIIIVFEPDIDLISVKINDDDCEQFLALTESLHCNLFLITDSQPVAAFLNAKAIVESINILAQERLFAFSFREESLFSEIDSKFKDGNTMIGDLQYLGFFVDELHMMMNSLITFTQAPPRIITYKSSESHDAHAVITASGPSLDKNLPLLKLHRDSYHLFCCYSTLGTLAKNDLKPDFHCNTERHCMHLPMLADPPILELAKEIILLCSANNDPRMNSLYRDTAAIFRSASCASALFAQSNTDCISGEGPQVANLALLCAILLGYRTIHLFGVDLGAATRKAARTSSAYIYDRRGSRNLNKKVLGNLGNQVWVDGGLLESARFMALLISGNTLPGGQAVQGLTIYNYGEGQLIEGTITSKPDSFCRNLKHSIETLSAVSIIDSLARYDEQIARARFHAFDWRNRLNEYTNFARACIEAPLNPCSQELFLQLSERNLNTLTHQVLSRMMSGTLTRVWYIITVLNDHMHELAPEQRRAWENECRYILNTCLNNMERLVLEMIEYVEGLERLSDYNLESLGYHPL